LITAAIAAGSERVVVAVGGVASTDGGAGAVAALGGRLSVPVEVACDVEARFLDAADVFAAQKGATPEQVAVLRERLLRLEVPDQPGAGAAGGLAGGLAAIGATLVSGFDLVAGRLDLDGRIAGTDLVITGEGRVDATSSTGKVVGGVLAQAERAGVEALVIAGEVVTNSPIAAVSLVALCGRERALAEPAACLAEVVEKELTSRERTA
jgi:glycerate 2-kinase